MSDNTERTIRLILTVDDLEDQARQLIELVKDERRAAAEVMRERCAEIATVHEQIETLPDAIRDLPLDTHDDRRR